MTATEAALDLLAVYEDSRSRFIDLVTALPPDMLDRTVPACPKWTARDIVAHLTGASEDFIVANFPVAPMTFEDWTDAQVARRRGRPLDEMLRDWDSIQPATTEGFANGAIPFVPVINDIVTHEQDIRAMAGLPGGRDSNGYRFSWDRWILGISGRITDAGLPALVLRTEWEERVAGEGDPGPSVTAPHFELMRALAGRRSLAQIAAFTWQGDASPYIPLVPSFRPPDHDIVEVP